MRSRIRSSDLKRHARFSSSAESQRLFRSFGMHAEYVGYTFKFGCAGIGITRFPLRDRSSGNTEPVRDLLLAKALRQSRLSDSSSHLHGDNMQVALTQVTRGWVDLVGA